MREEQRVVLNDNLRRAMRAPRAVARRIRDRFFEIGPKVYVASEGNRSESDNGLYVRFVDKAVRDPVLFSKFKQNRQYQAILEHLRESDGQAYLEIVEREAPDLAASMERFKINDLIGSPTTFVYDRVGRINPTTLRYVKVAADLRRLFGDLNGAKIAEIGVGYGGQLLILDQIFALGMYSMFDLPPVLDLVSKYLEVHILNAAYRPRTLNRSDGSDIYDLVISNYAFSELPIPVQKKYIEKVMLKARRGYLTMNSGTDKSLFAKGHLSIEQLRAVLPKFELLEEKPLTAHENYILVWGHGRSGD